MDELKKLMDEVILLNRPLYPLTGWSWELCLWEWVTVHLSVAKQQDEDPNPETPKITVW